MPLQCSCLENLLDRGAWGLQCSLSQESDTTKATPHACTHSACMHTLCMRAHTLKMLRNGRKQYSSGLRKEHGLLDLKEDSIIKGKVVNF